jgi:RNA polymerase sigma-70 factor (ECF subfamily)
MRKGAPDGLTGLDATLRGWGDKIASTVAEPTNPPESAPVAAEAVYHELRRLAAAYMRRERPGQTLQATALVNEAYLRLADAGIAWKDRNHFMGVAARSMKQILVDRARARGAQKRWGGMDRVSLTDALVKASDEDAMLPALDEALARLEQVDPEQSRIVELRYFVGLTNEEIADALQISVATVKRRWALARAWLFRELSGRAS